MKSKHKHTLKFAPAANAVVCIYCDFRISEMDVLEVLQFATESGLTQLAPDGADVCHIVTHVFIDGTCAMCGFPEPRPAGKA